jgi:uncharacterized damage-inducible protein DinB
MLDAAQAMSSELEQEANVTRRVLERVPADRLTWRPHSKSMTLGQLALHVAKVPGDLANLSQLDGIDAETVDFHPPQPATAAEILPALETSLESARAVLAKLDAGTASGAWRLTAGPRELFTVPRIAMMRSLMLNHWYHHRGQLVVYLRLLDVPVPAVYGRSADENPFAKPAMAASV